MLITSFRVISRDSTRPAVCCVASACFTNASVRLANQSFRVYMPFVRALNRAGCLPPVDHHILIGEIPYRSTYKDSRTPSIYNCRILSLPPCQHLRSPESSHAGLFSLLKHTQAPRKVSVAVKPCSSVNTSGEERPPGRSSIAKM